MAEEAIPTKENDVSEVEVAPAAAPPAMADSRPAFQRIIQTNTTHSDSLTETIQLLQDRERQLGEEASSIEQQRAMIRSEVARLSHARQSVDASTAEMRTILETMHPVAGPAIGQKGGPDA